MKAYRVSKAVTDTTTAEKVEAIKGYSVGDLLYTLREIENHPRDYEDDVIKEVAGQLYKNNIICM